VLLSGCASIEGLDVGLLDGCVGDNVGLFVGFSVRTGVGSGVVSDFGHLPQMSLSSTADGDKHFVSACLQTEMFALRSPHVDPSLRHSSHLPAVGDAGSVGLVVSSLGKYPIRSDDTKSPLRT
jgi:hypothetical protein